jgi:hypothetical protein
MTMPKTAGPNQIFATIHDDNIVFTKGIEIVNGKTGPTVLMKLKNDFKGKMHARIDMHDKGTINFEARNGATLEIGKKSNGTWVFDDASVKFEDASEDGYLYLTAASKISKDTVVAAFQVKGWLSGPWNVENKDVSVMTSVPNVSTFVNSGQIGLSVMLNPGYYSEDELVMKINLTKTLEEYGDSHILWAFMSSGAPWKGPKLTRVVKVADLDKNGDYHVVFNAPAQTVAPDQYPYVTVMRMVKTDKDVEFDVAHPTDNGWMDI